MPTRFVAVLIASLVGASGANGQATPEAVLVFKPSQRDVDYDSPAAADVKKCRLELEKFEKNYGYAVFDPTGLILRRLIDTNGDRLPDVYRYYRNGIEVYRDIDSNFNQKIDQCRWLNTGGSRWGLDANEDGKIDEWKSLSAEEATRVAVNAMVADDVQLLTTVLVTRDDLEQLGLNADLAKEMLRQVQEPSASLKTVLANSKVLTSQSKWTRLDAAMPGLIPADEGKSKADLLVYEGAMAFIETNNQHGIVQIGELIKVGDVWKLTQIPKPVSGNEVSVALGGLLMRPANQSPQIATELSPEMQQLLSRLQELDQKVPPPTATRAEVQKYHADRKQIITQLVRLSTTTQQRDLWMQQLINGVVASVQYGNAEGIRELKSIEQDLRQKTPKSTLIAYTVFRRLFAEYSLAMQSAKEPKDQQKANETWLKQIEEFVKEFPDGDDTTEALMQLAVNSELSGDSDAARKWYTQLVSRSGNEAASQRAAGAIRRLGLKGNSLKISGRDPSGRELDLSAYRGKVTLVIFWATNSQQFAADLPVMRALYEQYNDRGFEVLGVSFDEDPQNITAFAQQNRVPWPSIHDAPQSENALSTQYGIASVPLLMLLDREGIVLSNNITVNELKERLAQMFRTK